MQHIQENTIHAVEHADVRVVPGALAYTEENKVAIAANWEQERALKPALFDGEVFLAPEATLHNGLLRAGFRRTSFATLMYWRKDHHVERPWHIFAVGVIVSREGHLIAARMSSQSAADGRVYFPAGSIDDHDITEGRVDHAGNMRREVMEETGLDLNAAHAEKGFTLVSANRSIALFRRYSFDMPTRELVQKIEAHMHAQEDAELAAIIPVTAKGQMGDATPSYVRAFADWHFALSTKPA